MDTLSPEMLGFSNMYLPHNHVFAVKLGDFGNQFHETIKAFDRSEILAHTNPPPFELK